MDQADQFFALYQDLQRYLSWSNADAQRVQQAGLLVSPNFAELVDDFYSEIQRHPAAHRVISGGAAQIARLKHTLEQWLGELFSGQYDSHYVQRRWQVGHRHVEIGLDQVYVHVALARLRAGLQQALAQSWRQSAAELSATRRSLDLLLDLDLAIIDDAYQAAFMDRQQRIDRLAAIGQMAGGVAHELRNPLNVIKTSVYFLLHANSATDDKRVEHLNRIERQVGLADKVITALSDFARLPYPEVRPVQVADILAEALEVAALPANVAVEIDLPADPPPLRADRDQLQIVLVNLLRNARDAMPQGGRLLLSAQAQRAFVELTVTDTGCGIPPDVQARIMEPLFTTKSRGLGLGLAITRSIIDKHQGQWSVSSQVGQGTTFVIHWPAAESLTVVPHV